MYLSFPPENELITALLSTARLHFQKLISTVAVKTKDLIWPSHFKRIPPKPIKHVVPDRHAAFDSATCHDPIQSPGEIQIRRVERYDQWLEQRKPIVSPLDPLPIAADKSLIIVN
jgi:hypothetical protein